jgi:hypothetical protein
MYMLMLLQLHCGYTAASLPLLCPTTNLPVSVTFPLLHLAAPPPCSPLALSLSPSLSLARSLALSLSLSRSFALSVNATDAGLNRDEAEATEEVHTQDDSYKSEQGESGRGSGGGRCVGVSGGEGGLAEEEVGVHSVEEAEAAVSARCEEEGLRMLVGVPLQVGPLLVYEALSY